MIIFHDKINRMQTTFFFQNFKKEKGNKWGKNDKQYKRTKIRRIICIECVNDSSDTLSTSAQARLKAGSLEDEDCNKNQRKKDRNVADFTANNHLLFIMPLVKTRSRYMALQ